MIVGRRLAAALLTAFALAACGGDGETATDTGEDTAAADYPSEQIRLIVPYTAGGPTDIAARAVARFMEQELDETVLVENLPGASGASAYQQLIAAEPDGHTLSMFALPTATLNYLLNDVGYTAEDFTPIGVITRVPSAIVVPADSPYKDIESLFEAARQNPGEITIGTPGATNTHAAETARIKQIYDVPLTIVPFNGNSEVQAALLGNNVDAGFLNVSQDVLPNFESGQIRPLAVGSEEPLDYVDAPTFVEAGYPELTQSTTTFGLIGPAGMPEEVVTKLEDTLGAALEDPEVVKTLDERYVGEEFIGAEETAELFKNVEETFKDVEIG